MQCTEHNRKTPKQSDENRKPSKKPANAPARETNSRYLPLFSFYMANIKPPESVKFDIRKLTAWIIEWHWSIKTMWCGVGRLNIRFGRDPGLRCEKFIKLFGFKRFWVHLYPSFDSNSLGIVISPGSLATDSSWHMTSETISSVTIRFY